MKLKNDCLKMVCQKVSLKDGMALAGRMSDFCKKINKNTGIIYCLGLAANQIGSTKRVAIVWTGSYYEPFINPVVIDKSKEMIVSKEGCLSFPGININCYRHEWIVVSCDNWKVPRTISTNLNFQICCAVQHEIDHLDGITIQDREIKNND